MNKHRIYTDKVDIQNENTIKFYDERAERIADMECPYTAVLLGDQNPEYAEKWNEFEKNMIIPTLNFSAESKVLEFGCGMGRWAENIIPHVSYYYGTDFSSSMIDVARKRCQFPTGKYKFVNKSAQEVVDNPPEIKFSHVIMCGVSMYINDSAIEKIFEKLDELLDNHCTIFLTETIALETRLTLSEFPSEALKTNYDVIYRTEEEYMNIYQPLINRGFHVAKRGFMPHLNEENQYSETDRWFIILERK